MVFILLYIYTLSWFSFVLSMCLVFELCLTQHFCFLGLFWDTVDMSVSLPSDKLFEAYELVHSLLWSQPITLFQIMCFWTRPILVPMDMHTFPLRHIIQSNMLNVYHSLFHAFCVFFTYISTYASTLEIVSAVTESGSLSVSSSSCGYHYGCYALSVGLSFQGSVLPLCCSATWSYSMQKVHIALL